MLEIGVEQLALTHPSRRSFNEVDESHIDGAMHHGNRKRLWPRLPPFRACVATQPFAVTRAASMPPQHRAAFFAHNVVPVRSDAAPFPHLATSMCDSMKNHLNL